MGRFLVTGLLIALTASTAFAGVESNIEKEVIKGSKIGKSENAWSIEKEQLVQQLQEAKLQLVLTRFSIAKHQKWLLKEQENISNLKARLKKSAETRKEIEPLMELYYDRLEKFVKADLPFHQEERKRRLAFIRNTFDDPESSLGHRLARLLEAIQVEYEYGFSVDSFDELATVKGAKTQVTVFRLGRLAMFRIYDQGSKSQKFDTATNKWFDLSSEQTRVLNKAIAIAAKKRVASILDIPAGNLNDLIAVGGTK